MVCGQMNSMAEAPALAIEDVAETSGIRARRAIKAELLQLERRHLHTPQ